MPFKRKKCYPHLHTYSVNIILGNCCSHSCDSFPNDPALSFLHFFASCLPLPQFPKFHCSLKSFDWLLVTLAGSYWSDARAKLDSNWSLVTIFVSIGLRVTVSLLAFRFISWTVISSSLIELQFSESGRLQLRHANLISILSFIRFRLAFPCQFYAVCSYLFFASLFFLFPL